MTLKKLTNDHYVIVDDSEIKEGDLVLETLNNVIFQVKVSGNDYKNSTFKKITHSTQPLEYSSKIGKYWGRVQPIELSEVKELIGEVDVEKKSYDILKGFVITKDERRYFELGYTKALEDNKEKKWTDEDVIRIVEKSRETGLTAEYLMMTFQPKTEWEVEFVDGKMKLKK